MKKTQIVMGTIGVCVAVGLVAIQAEKPVLLQKVATVIRYSVNKKINGSLQFSSLQIDWQGAVVLQHPVITDRQGRIVVSGNKVTLQLNPWRLLSVWKGANAAVAIDRVDIDAPTLHVWRNVNDKQWNIQSILQFEQSHTDNGFRAVIGVRNGTIRASLPGRTGIRIKDCNGTADFSSPQKVRVNLDGKLEGRQISLQGVYGSSQFWQGTLRSDGIPLVWCQAIIPPQAVPVTFQGGMIQRLRIGASQHGTQRRLQGQLEIQAGKAAVKGVHLTAVDGTLVLDSSVIHVRQMQGKVNGQAVQVAGNVDISGAVPQCNMAVDAERIQLRAFPAYVPQALTGEAGFSGRIQGKINDLQVQGRVTVPRASYQGVSLRQGRAEVEFKRHRLAVKRIYGQAANGTVTGDGTYDGKTHIFSAKLKVAQMQLAKIPYCPRSLQGVITGNIWLHGPLTISGIQAAVQGTVRNLTYKGVQIPYLQGNVQYTGGMLRVSSMQAHAGGGAVQLQGTYDYNRRIPDFSFRIQGVQPQFLSTRLPIAIRGIWNGKGAVYGPLWQWRLQFQAVKGAVQQRRFDTLTGELQGDRHMINIQQAQWRYHDGIHTAQGRVNVAAKTLNLSIHSNRVRLEDIAGNMVPRHMRVTGWAANDVLIRGQWTRPEAIGRIHLWDGSVQGYLYQQVQGDYHYQDHTLYLNNVTASAYDANFTAKGSVGKKMDLAVHGQSIEVPRFIRNSPLQPQGFVDVQLHVGGTPTAPDLQGNVRSRRFIVQGFPMEAVNGDFSYVNHIWRLNNLSFRQGQGKYSAVGTVNVRTGKLSAYTKIAQGNLQNILQVAHIPVQNVKGSVDGEIRVQGTRKDPHVDVVGTLTQAALNGLNIEPSPVHIMYNGKTVTIRSLVLKSGDAVLAVKGKYSFYGPVHMQVALRKFPSTVLTGILGHTRLPLISPVDLVADIKGTAQQLQADVSAQLNGGTINGIPFDKAYALGNFKQGKFMLNQATITKGNYRVSANGVVPLRALTDEKSRDPLAVTLKLDKANLDALTFLTPRIQAATGEVKGNLTLGGTAARPLVHGEVTCEDGTVKFRDVKYPLQHIVGLASFQGNHMVMDVKAAMDKEDALHPGTIAIQGEAAWQGRRLTQYKVTADADHPVIYSPYFKGPLNGHLLLRNRQHKPILSGIVQIAHAVIKPPLAMSSSASLPNIGLDLTVSSGQSVRLYNPAICDLMITGSATFRGSTRQPKPFGKFEARSGLVRYLDTNFKIAKAQADFSQRNSLLPTVDIEGNSRIGQYDVGLTLRGPVERMDMILRSNPPLTKQQIVSLITLRNGNAKQQSSLDDKDFHQLLGSGLRMTLNSLGITQQLERVLALDRLMVTNGSLNLNDRNTDLSKNYYNIEMGKYIYDNVMLTAAFGLNHQDNRVGIQYDLTRGLSIDTWKSKDSSFLGATYRYSF